MEDHVRLAIFCAMGTAFFFGLNPILIKKGLDSQGDQTRGTFYMLLFHLVSMGALLFVFGGESVSLQIGRKEIAWLALAGISNFALAFSCYFRSIAILGASRTASFVNANPSISVVLAVLFLGEAIEPRAWFAILAILAGAFLIGKA